MITSKFYGRMTKVLALTAVLGVVLLALGGGTVFMLMVAWALKHMWIALFV